jgi:F-type H+-transporting ATPase subunit epsilon
MADRLKLEIVTPERRVVAEEVDEVVVPAEDGYLGARYGHAPTLLRLQVGEMSFRLDGKEHILAISGGYAEIQRTAVAVLAETCEPAEDIDVDRAKRAQERAQRRLSGQDQASDFRRAEVSLKRAMNRIGAHARGRSMMGA